MPSMLAILLAQVSWLLAVNDYLYRALNDIAGRSWFLDQFLGLGLTSPLVKASVISACFMFAWMSGSDRAVTASRRKILLITLVSAVFALAGTKMVSKTVFLPRPYVLSERTFHLEGDALVESQRTAFNVPNDPDIEKSVKELRAGDIHENDMISFPSDHAGFFICIATGIFLAFRTAGLIALLWTIFVPLAGKLIFGQHSPIDIVAGAAIGVGVLLSLQLLLGRWGGKILDPIVRWTMNNSAMSAALVFIVLFEVTNTLDDVRQIGRFGKDAVRHVRGS